MGDRPVAPALFMGSMPWYTKEAESMTGVDLLEQGSKANPEGSKPLAGG